MQYGLFRMGEGKNMKIRYLAALFGMLLFTGAFSSQVYAAEEEVKIKDGVFIEEFDMSGKTKAEAREMLESHYKELAASEFVVKVEGEPVATNWEGLGLAWELDEVLDQAANLGQAGGWIALYKAQTDLKTDKEIIEVPLTITQEMVREFVETKLTELNCEPQDATITRKNGAFVVSDHAAGRQIDVDPTVQAILTAADTGVNPGKSVDAVVAVVEPVYTKEELSLIQDVLGTATTDVSGTENRLNNVKVGSGNINGKLLNPGESASASEMMKKRSKDNGYKKAPQYVDGQTKDAYGGGVCQVSSTLYNALLAAELQVDERNAHSMVVSYLDPSKDAAIADGSKDLKFTNNLDHPVYIEATCENRKLIFTVYGVESRPENRKVEYVSTTVYRNQPADKIQYDSSQPASYQNITGNRHPSVKSYLEKVVYLDGQEVERTRLHTDQYSSSVKTVTYGSRQPVSAVVVSETPRTEAATAPAETEIPAEPIP